jgi:hypothetical protein
VKPPAKASERPPRVSVVAAIYNGAADVEAACRSVLAQTFADFELVIVDDGSTDETPEIVQRLGSADPRIKYFRNAAQMGQTRSLNRGLQLARGELIARIDADDLFRPAKLERQVEFIDAHPEIDVVGTWAMMVNETGAPIGVFQAPLPRAAIDFALLHSSPICHVSVLMRRSAALSVGGYQPEFRYAADFKLWSDLRRAGSRFANLDEVLVDYRVSTSTFGGASRLGAAADEAATIIRENAHALCGIEIDHALGRGIHLRSEPGAGLSAAERRHVFLTLHDFAFRIYGRVPLSLRARLVPSMIWSFAIAEPGGIQSSDATPTAGAISRAAVWLAEQAGRLLRTLGPERVNRLRAKARKVLTR